MSIEEHNAKYDRLIEEMGGLDVVRRRVRVSNDRIAEAYSTDVHLNNISLHNWDRWAGLLSLGPYEVKLTHGDGWPKGLSLAERVCMLKRAAVRSIGKEG